MRDFLTFAAAIAGLVLLTFVIGTLDRDDTDPPGGHSELVPRTDAATGCQYLTTPFGLGITPRLDSNGKQVCK